MDYAIQIVTLSVTDVGKAGTHLCVSGGEGYTADSCAG